MNRTSTRTALRFFAPAILVGLLGFALTLDLRVQQQAAGEQAGRRAELARIATVRQQRTAELERRLADLRAQLDELAASTDDEGLRRLRALSEELALASGTAAVGGPGLVVELADGDEGASVDEADTKIQDVDIQGVVNELWGAGAEAVAVNGQRLVGTSAIRNAGGAVLVNFKVLTSPYRISAIGDRALLSSRFQRSETAAHFHRWTQIYGLGFAVRESDTIEMPAFAGGLRFTEARVGREKGEG